MRFSHVWNRGQGIQIEANHASDFTSLNRAESGDERWLQKGDTMKRTVFAVGMLVAGMALGEIEIDGVGRAKAPPDLALTTFNFTVRETNLGTLGDAGRKKLSAITNQISQLSGVVGFAVGHSRVSEADSIGSSGDGAPKIYERSYAIQLQTKPDEREALRLAQFGLDNNLKLTGETRWSQEGLVVYALKDFQGTYLLALREAMKNARSRAETVADLSDLVLGKIKSVSVTRKTGWASGTTQGFEFTSNDPTEIEVEVNVRVTFESSPKTAK
jgi:hypothetical protein